LRKTLVGGIASRVFGGGGMATSAADVRRESGGKTALSRRRRASRSLKCWRGKQNIENSCCSRQATAINAHQRGSVKTRVMSRRRWLKHDAVRDAHKHRV